jgi:hypothetical protein
MVVKLFVLGLPGSGKSTVCRHIEDYVAGYTGWSTIRINDFDILYEMCKEDTDGKYFHSIPGYTGRGFNIHDVSAFDMALKKMKRMIQNYIPFQPWEELIVIEFSRNDYGHAFEQFGHPFLEEAYFLFLNADIETCKKRIQYRIHNPTTPEDHFVSDYIFNTYYSRDTRQYPPSNLREVYGVSNQRIEVIDNNGSFQDIVTRIDQFISTIFQLETHRLPQTDAIPRVPKLVSNGELTCK